MKKLLLVLLTVTLLTSCEDSNCQDIVDKYSKRYENKITLLQKGIEADQQVINDLVKENIKLKLKLRSADTKCDLRSKKVQAALQYEEALKLQAKAQLDHNKILLKHQKELNVLLKQLKNK